MAIAWVISAAGPEIGFCPGCNEQSTRRHSRYFGHLQDLPAQGAAVMEKMQVSRWRCQNRECESGAFTDQLPEIVCPHARRTQRAAGLVHIFGHGAGGRPGERLMNRLGMLKFLLAELQLAQGRLAPESRQGAILGRGLGLRRIKEEVRE